MNDKAEIEIEKEEEKRLDNRRNFIFDLLYMLAIIMVIDDHTNSQLGIMNKIFPYDSFFMPLFVFASGYFYKKQNIINNVKHRIKRILVPAIIWNIVMLFIAFIIDKLVGTNWALRPNLRSFIISLFEGTLTSLNGPAWFVVMLFWVSIIYNILRNIFKPSKINDTILTIIFTVLGFLTVHLSSRGLYANGAKYVFSLKLVFYIQFFNLGYMFKKYIEERINKIKRWKICIPCILINCILIFIFGEKVNFFSTSEMNGFSYWFLPLITSITGILFWYTIMSEIASIIKQNKIVTFIAKNTFTIMETHLMFANIVNIVFYMLYKTGIPYFKNFDEKVFIYTAWNGAAWRLNPFVGIFGFIIGLSLSVLTIIVIDKTKNILKKKVEEKWMIKLKQNLRL